MEPSPLALNALVVKEHIGAFRASNNYDLFDPATGCQVMAAREENLGVFTKILRFTDWKAQTPFEVMVRDADGKLIVRVKRGFALIRSTVEVFDGAGVLLGSFRQKVFSLGGAFSVLDAQGQELCQLKGKWTSWDFTFGLEGVEFGRVSKQWAGIGKELFTSADNYVLTMDASLAPDHPLRKLILAAVMCIDFVLKEG